eukprot:COSAG02_NODE_26086_length_641_cov_1.053506_1_plen_142_part_10
MLDSLNVLRSAESDTIDGMVATMRLSDSAEVEFRANLEVLQQAPTSLEGWLDSLSLPLGADSSQVQLLSAMQEYLRTTRFDDTLAGLHEMNPSAVPGALTAMGLDASQKAQFRVALSELQTSPSPHSTELETFLTQLGLDGD